MAASTPTWTILAFVVAIVAPLYGHAAYMIWKRFQTKQNADDIEDHSDEIRENTKTINKMQKSLVQLEYEIQLVQNDLGVIHDNVTDSNHCGVEDCRWCEGEPGE